MKEERELHKRYLLIGMDAKGAAIKQELDSVEDDLTVIEALALNEFEPVSLADVEPELVAHFRQVEQDMHRANLALGIMTPADIERQAQEAAVFASGESLSLEILDRETGRVGDLLVSSTPYCYGGSTTAHIDWREAA